MKLYGHPLSGNSHRVQAFLELLEVPFEYEMVDLSTGAHKQPDYLALNPLGQVPVLVDGDLVLRDSSAILIYLAGKFDTENKWLPSDIVAKARVQEWLSTAVNEIMSGPFVVRAIKVFGMASDAEVAVAKTTALFDTLFEPHLKDREWLVGESATIADIACYSYVARVTEGDFSLENYPAISAWLSRIESLPNFPQMVHAHEFMAGS